jgi:hypothetical protein
MAEGWRKKRRLRATKGWKTDGTWWRRVEKVNLRRIKDKGS